MAERYKPDSYVITRMTPRGDGVYINKTLGKDGNNIFGMSSMDGRVMAFSTKDAAIKAGRDYYGNGTSTNWGVFGYRKQAHMIMTAECYYEQAKDYKKTIDIPELIAESYNTGYGSEKEFGG